MPQDNRKVMVNERGWHERAANEEEEKHWLSKGFKHVIPPQPATEPVAVQEAPKPKRGRKP